MASNGDRVYLLSYELRPSDDNPQREGIGGAFVNCWVRSGSPDAARSRAADHLRASGWVIVAALNEVAVDPARCPPEALGYVQKAEAEGEVFVIHAFPPEPGDA
jgi:hypothetical protein